MAIQREGLFLFSNSQSHAFWKDSPVAFVVSLFAKFHRSSSVRYFLYPYRIIGVIQLNVRIENTVAYSIGHSSSSPSAWYALFCIGTSHSNPNSMIESPNPTQYAIKSDR